MGETQQIRIAALNAAIALAAANGGSRLPDVIATADRIAEWITLGTLPKPPAGTFD